MRKSQTQISSKVNFLETSFYRLSVKSFSWKGFHFSNLNPSICACINASPVKLKMWCWRKIITVFTHRATSRRTRGPDRGDSEWKIKFMCVVGSFNVFSPKHHLPSRADKNWKGKHKKNHCELFLCTYFCSLRSGGVCGKVETLKIKSLIIHWPDSSETSILYSWMIRALCQSIPQATKVYSLAPEIFMRHFPFSFPALNWKLTLTFMIRC